MKFLKQLFRDNPKKEEDKMKEFIKVLHENNEWRVKNYILYSALRLCGNELYTISGNLNHLSPDYWIDIINNRKEF